MHFNRHLDANFDAALLAEARAARGLSPYTKTYVCPRAAPAPILCKNGCGTAVVRHDTSCIRCNLDADAARTKKMAEQKARRAALAAKKPRCVVCGLPMRARHISGRIPCHAACRHQLAEVLREQEQETSWP